MPPAPPSDAGPSEPGTAPAGPWPGRLGARLYAYALPLIGTVPGIPAGQVAATAVHDALAVAAALGPGLADRDDRDAVALALTRNECLRQLRARAVFVDTRARTWLPDVNAPGALVAAALLGLAPGDRDVLALGWVARLPSRDAAHVIGVPTAGALERRTSGARDALARESGALFLAASPEGCPGLIDVLVQPERDDDGDRVVGPLPEDDTGADAVGREVAEDGTGADAVGSAAGDAPDGLSPGRRDRIARHALGCERCTVRRRAFLEEALPGFALPALRELPPRPDVAAGIDVVARAGPLGADGYPVPLDHDDVVGVRWLRRAVLAGVVSAGLLLVGSLLYLALARG